MRNPERLIASPALRRLVRLLGYRTARWFLYLTAAPSLIPKDARCLLRATVEAHFSRFLPVTARESPSDRAAAYIRHYKLRVCEDCLALNLSAGRTARALSGMLLVDGRENLQHALEMGRGVLAVGSHVGTVIIGTLAFVSLCGHCAGGQPRSVRICADRRVAQFFMPGRRDDAVEYSFIPSDLEPRQIIRRILCALNAQEIVTMNLDVLSGGSSAEPFQLFDDVLVYLPAIVSVAKLAILADAVILPWTNSRERRGRIRLRFERPIVPGDDLDGLKEELRSLLEEWILQNPEQWTYWDRFGKRLVSHAAV